MTGHPPVTDAPGADRASDPAAIGQPALPLVYLGHDLQAALADMRAGLHLLCDLSFPDSVQDTLLRCVVAGESLSRLIDQSVLVCLGEASPGLTKPAPIVLDDLLTGLNRRWPHQARDSGHRFVVEAAPDLPETATLDLAALDRVLTNLITNALRHTPACTVRLAITCDQAYGGLRFDLSDGGPGFAPDQLDRLSKGESLPKTAARPDGGFGLQSVVYLVQSMGGQVSFANTSGAGATVCVRLPLGAAVRCQDQPPSRHQIDGLRILLAEDSVAPRTLMETLLTRMGAKVTLARDGAETVALLSGPAPLPDLLILDEEMPNLSGLEVLHWMTNTLAPPQRPVVLALTCHAATARIDALLQAGAARVRAKPILDLDELDRALQEVLATRPAKALPTAEVSALQRLAEIAGPVAAAELFERLTEDLMRVREGLAKGAQDGDLAAIRADSHILIALAGTAGATALHDDAVRLNGLVHDAGPPERLRALAQAMDGAIADLLDAVQDMAATLRSPTAKP